ncbi:hypothetical protein LC612_30020 [Nostoc sp. CHAB 5834]|nr:hypothetical protein [Nostoc sp. CHAB 5834]
MYLQATPTDPVNNVWVIIVVTLFVLSMINERFTNILKLYLQIWFPDQRRDPTAYSNAPQWRRYIGDVLKLKNLSIPEIDIEDDRQRRINEKNRESGLITLTLICSIIIAIASGADLFLIIRSAPKTGLISYDDIWKRVKDIPIEEQIVRGSLFLFRHSIGFICTGLFISLGSKFWHDILDLLLFSSNVKRKLADPQTFQGETADAIVQRLQFTERQLASMALDQNTTLLSNDNVLYIMPGQIVNPDKSIQPCLWVHLKDNNFAGFPATIPVELPGSGQKLTVQLRFILNAQIPQLHIGSGDALTGEEHKLGTVCCILRKKRTIERYLLTCQHVQTGGAYRNDGGAFNGGPVHVRAGLSDQNNKWQFVGRWSFGLLTENLDVALVKLQVALPTQSTPFSSLPRAVTAADEFRTPVTMIGQVSGLQSGFIVNDQSDSVPFQFKDGVQQLRKLLVAARFTDGMKLEKFSDHGDSGAILYDATTRVPLGMVMGGSPEYTFAIPFDTLLRGVLSDYEIDQPNLPIA